MRNEIALFLVLVCSIPSVIYSQSEQPQYFAHFFFKEMPGISNLKQHGMYSAYQTSEMTHHGIALLNKNRIQPQRKSVLLRLPTRYSYSFESRNESSASQKPIKYLTHGLIGAASFGFLGVLIASGTNRTCAGSSDVFRVCGPSAQSVRLGFAIGTTTGSIFSYWVQTKKFKKKKGVLLPIVLGSIAGGVAGYFLDKEASIGPLAIIFPPGTAFLSLTIFSPEF